MSELSPEDNIFQEKIKDLIDDLNKATIFSPEWIAQMLSSISPENGEQLENEKVQIYRLKNFLTDEECDFWVDKLKDRTEPSKIFGGEEDYRVSKSCTLAATQDEEIIFKSLELDVKISNALNIHPSYGEPIEFERFQSGDFFKVHTDYFDAGTFDSQEVARHQGQRTWTFAIYLNKPEQGGLTRFPLLENVEIIPEKGMAIAWNNISPNAFTNELTAHQEEVVLKGSKNILTKCFRDRVLN